MWPRVALYGPYALWSFGPLSVSSFTHERAAALLGVAIDRFLRAGISMWQASRGCETVNARMDTAKGST